MAENRHITASAYQGGNFTAGKLPTVTLNFPRINKRNQLIITHIGLTRAQQVIDKYVESMESDGIMGKSPSAW